MKKTFMTLAISTLMLGTAAMPMASARMFPDTSQITSQTKYVLVGEGKNEMPKYITKNPHIYNRQQIDAGVIEGVYDNKNSRVNVYMNGRLTKSTKIYDISDALARLDVGNEGDYKPSNNAYEHYDEKALAELGDIGSEGDYILRNR